MLGRREAGSVLDADPWLLEAWLRLLGGAGGSQWNGALARMML